MKHDLYEPERLEGCAACRICKGAEGTLTTDCCGAPITYEESEAIYAGQIDFKGGKWISKDLKS